MLQLTIPYESKWGNSFLDGDNNSPLPKKGRSYVASSQKLNDATDGEQNFIRRTITIDTVMGVLNRLIGDRRKLYQSRACCDYFFKEVEVGGLVTFEDHISAETQEMVFLRNMGNNTDQNAFSGMINASHPAFTSAFSAELWGVLFLPLGSLCDFVINNTPVTPRADVCPLTIAEQFESVVSKIKAVKVASDPSEQLDNILKTESLLSARFDANYRNAAGTSIQVSALYCSALYLQIERLGHRYDLRCALTKAGGVAGFSKRGFTFKDFMKAFTTGDGKIVFGNPYCRDTFVKGAGKIREMLNKTSGRLVITLDVNDEHAREIMNMISNAGVMGFPLGKKGLAYVDAMRII